MKFVVVAACAVAAATAAPQALLPAGLSAAECINYPFCGPTPGTDVPIDTNAAAVYAAQQRILASQFALSQPIAANVPGFGAHQAAEAEVLAAQGRVPGSPIHAGNEARVLQAQADLIALQEQLAAAPAFTGLVGASGVVGPSGLVGPSGSLAF